MGNTRPGELQGTVPVCSKESVRNIAVHPLSDAVRIHADGSGPVVEPCGVANVYTAVDTISDSQVLAADLLGLRPSAICIGTLSTVGYLPGNMTLFSALRRIPFLEEYDVGTGRFRRTAAGAPARHDDEAMLDRLVDVCPRGVPAYIAMSGGYDTRLTLGILLRAGLSPRLCRHSDPEDDIVRRIAEVFDLPLEITPGVRAASGGEYTLLTDVQIYDRGGRYGRIRHMVPFDATLHIGHFSSVNLHNAHMSTWKIPCRRRSVKRRLIDVGLLAQCPEVVPGLRTHLTRRDLADHLEDALAYQWTYTDLPTRKAAACWFFYINRGIRWSQASVQDLSFSTTPTFILADLQAAMFGIGSPAPANFRDDRIRALNRELLPTVDVPYFDGQPAASSSGIGRRVGNLGHEFLGRLGAYRAQSREAAGRRETSPHLPGREPSGFGDYFAVNSTALLGNAAPPGTKRAAITIAWLLDYMETPPPPEQDSSGAPANESPPQ